MDPKPPAPDILEAVSAWILSEAVPALANDRGRAFKARIAANLVAVAAREIRHGQDATRALHQDICVLLDASPDDLDLDAALMALAGRLRTTPAADPFSNRAREHIMHHLAARLAISNPRFATDLHLEEDDSPT